jgi:hypothetical protein
MLLLKKCYFYYFIIDNIKVNKFEPKQKDKHLLIIKISTLKLLVLFRFGLILNFY